MKNFIRIKLRENLNEIDWENTYSDVGETCISVNVLTDFLNKELDRLNYNQANRNKTKTRGTKDLIMGRKTLEAFVGEGGDIQKFIKNITMEPDEIFSRNPKMEKSDTGRDQETHNTGLPAIVGIVYDLENKKFHLVSTCPSAGKCIIDCYGRKAFYGMDDSKIMRLTRRLNLLFNNPDRFKEKIFEELLPLAEKFKESSVGMPTSTQLVLRWNDAGDFFGQKYYNIAKEVTKELLDNGYNVKSYAYTKGAEYVLQNDDKDNFIINFSTDAKKADVEKMKGKDDKFAVIVPKELFKNDIYKKKSGHYVKTNKELPMFLSNDSPNILKDRIYNVFGKEHGISRDSLKFTYELPRTPNENEKFKYNVVVHPTGDSDIGAQRNDVKYSYLLYH